MGVGGTRIEVSKVQELRHRGGGGIRTSVPLPNRLRAGADPGVEIGGHIGPYMVSAEHEPITQGLGAMPPAWSRGRAPGQGAFAP